MSSGDCPRSQRSADRQIAGGDDPKQPFWLRWFLANSLLAGIFALFWLLLRSGTKPSRLVYPCQQAAFSTAASAFGAPLVALLITLRKRVVVGLRTRAAALAGVAGLVITVAAVAYLPGDDGQGLQVDPAAGTRARVFQVTDCPEDPVGDRFIGVDNLLILMDSQGLKLYRSPIPGPLAGPDGIIAADDVVVIKINYQWAERGGSNTDVLSGLLRNIVDHPDGFTGEIVVAENAQFVSTSDFDRDDNNAQDHTLSPHDVVMHFQALAWNVSHFDWTPIRYTSVDEYSSGDMSDGYVVYDYDPQLQGRVSYPKFQSSAGTYVSLRDGIWDPDAGSYDRDRLTLVNLPVLKSHSIYGVTAAVKNNMGVVTRELATNSHNAIRNGLLGGLLAEIRPADLNILDCIWINANPAGYPASGPATSYGEATRRDLLVAGTDPVALDVWATKNILIPAFLANGYHPPFPVADPDDPASDFREYLDNSMSYLLAGGFEVTNDLSQIDAYTWDGVAPLSIFADGFETGSIDRWSAAVP